MLNNVPKNNPMKTLLNKSHEDLNLFLYTLKKDKADMYISVINIKLFLYGMKLYSGMFTPVLTRKETINARLIRIIFVKNSIAWVLIIFLYLTDVADINQTTIGFFNVHCY